MEIDNYVYRIEAYHIAEYSASIRCEKYKIVKRTPCGVWIEECTGFRRFINQNARKQWSYPTHKEALQGFVARKKRQLQILSVQIECAEKLKFEAMLQLKKIEVV